MKMRTLECPNCSAPLEIENGLDTFYCKYCGSKIILEHQSNATIKAKVQMKRMEHEEALKEKEYAQERYKIEKQQKDTKRSILLGFVSLGLFLLICSALFAFVTISHQKQNEQLQAIVDQIMIDIENEDYDAAYIKATSLHWDGGTEEPNAKKWDAIQSAILEQIEEAKAEKEAEEAKANEAIAKEEPAEESSGILAWFNRIRGK